MDYPCAIAQAQGIDYMSSTSSLGVSTITATLRLNYDANRALTERDQIPKRDAIANQERTLTGLSQREARHRRTAYARDRVGALPQQS